MPLLARSGLAGMLVARPRAPAASGPSRDAEARLVSLIAARAALAVENHAYQKELIASERLAALGTMAGMLVHDFRGPMTLIRGWAETLLEGDVPPEEAAERARFIVDAVDRLERMTTETLDFARGAERLVLRSVPLGILLAELAAGIEAELPGLAVERDFDVPGGRRGTLDVDKIRRAVSNVAANARDAMGGQGRLRFSARIESSRAPDGSAEHLELVLADEGPGVSPEIRERVFEPFVTLGKKRGHRPRPRGGPPLRRGPRRHASSCFPRPGPRPAGPRFRFALPLAPPGSTPAPARGSRPRGQAGAVESPHALAARRGARRCSLLAGGRLPEPRPGEGARGERRRDLLDRGLAAAGAELHRPRRALPAEEHRPARRSAPSRPARASPPRTRTRPGARSRSR